MRRPVLIRHGICRTVLLVGPYAVKVPSLRGHAAGGVRGRLEGFCRGILANLSEATWSSFEPFAGRIAPVRFSLLGGLVQVYPRCEPAPEDAELFRLDPDPGDVKPDNFGLLDGRLVRVDFEMM